MENKDVVSAPIHPRDRLPKRATFIDGEIRRFENSIKEFDEWVNSISSSLEKIHVFSYFCSSLHKKIDWKIKHGESKMLSDFLSSLLKLIRNM